MEQANFIDNALIGLCRSSGQCRGIHEIYEHKSLEVVSGNYKSLLNREGNVDKITTTTVSGDIVRNILVKGIIKEGGEGQCVGLFFKLESHCEFR